MDGCLVHTCITQGFLNGFKSTSEKVCTQLLKSCTSDCGVEVDTFIQRINLNACLSAGRKSTLCTLTSGSQTTHCPLIVVYILLELALEFKDKVVDHT